MTTKPLHVYFVLSVLILVAAVPLRAATHVVRMTSSWTFSPAQLTVNAGDTVTWINDDDWEHTSTSTGGFWNSGDVSEGGSFSVIFDSAGTFPYRCIYHSNPAGTSGMIGAITVMEGTPQNTPPSVGLIVPQDGAVVASDSPFTIEAWASDSDGSIASVEFFANETSLGTAPDSTYRLTAGTLPSGAYAITAVATDNESASTVSDPIMITVVDPVPVVLSSPRIADGYFQFDFTANPGLSYVVYGSEGASSVSPMVELSTVTANESTVTFTDWSPGSWRMFRVGRVVD